MLYIKDRPILGMVRILRRPSQQARLRSQKVNPNLDIHIFLHLVEQKQNSLYALICNQTMLRAT